MRNKLRVFLDDWIGLDRPDNFILLAVLVATAMTAAGFWFGRTCSGLPLIGCLALSFLILLVCDWKCALRALAVVSVCFILTAFMFTYAYSDGAVYHGPMQRLLMNGWNPVFESTIDDVKRLTNGGCSAYHVLFIPHGIELIGAQVAKVGRLFTGESFISFVLLYMLFRTAARFAQREWDLSGFPTVVFALLVAMPFTFFLIFICAVDYPLYAAMAIALLSMLNYERSMEKKDLLAFALGLVLAMTIKFTGCYLGLIGWAYLLIRHRRKESVGGFLIAILIVVALIDAAPYVTSWIRYGSPFYPLQTFNPNVHVVDITDDFTCNSDAAQMGYLARIVYAWFSKKLAILGCAIYHGKSNFDPQFNVPGGVAGLKGLFKMLMWCSVGALLLAKRTRITVVCLLVFVLSNLAPLKYIGYGRYFTLIWLIPPLAAFNLITHPRNFLVRPMRIIRYGIYGLFFCFSLTIIAKASMHFIRQAAYEGVRRPAYAAMAASDCEKVPEKEWHRYIAHERMMVERNGTCATASVQHVEVGPYGGDAFMPYVTKETEEYWKMRFPVCYNWADYRKFKFCEAFRHWPSPLFER